MALQLKSVNSNMPEVEVVRRTGNFSPSLWGDRFASFSIDKKVMESYEEQIEALKETVTNMLMANFTSDSSLGNVRFIDLLCSLGVSYHFETKIEKQLAKAFEDYTTIVDNVGFDLYTVALLFRVFRQHGYLVPSDVFEKFRDSDGKFMEELSRDAKGMLSLYEASQLAMHGEEILDDALAFTKRHLESLATQSSPHLAKLITSSLYRPLHKCIPRLGARQFISFYEGEEESKSEILLKFAKIDYNRLQLLYKEDLCQLTRWYRNLDITSNLTYARDRIVEIYLCWGFGAYFEPQFSKTRRIITKFIEIVAVLDDTYDLHGTIEELRIFTDAIQRMDLNAVDELPEYMKYLYRLLLNMFDECDQELIKEGFSYNTSYTRDAFKELARGYLVEEEWCSKKHVPTVDEYVRNGLITSSYTAVVMSSFLGMGEIIADAKAFEWTKTLPKIHVASQEIGRLINDIVSHEAEQKRGHVASFIECYMKEYGVAKKEAVEACDKRIDEAWKNINEDFMKETSVPNVVLMRSVNLARGYEVAYRYDDGYTNPIESLRFHVETLLIQPIPI